MTLWHRKKTVMEPFFNKLPGCYLTKKHSTIVSFGWSLWNSSDQLFSKTYADEYFSSLCCFTSVLTQNNILKNLVKSHQKKNCDGVRFQWSCRLFGNWKKDFNNGFFWVNFWGNFSDQLFSKSASVLWKKLLYLCK